MNAVENRIIVPESKALTAITLREGAEELLRPFLDEFDLSPISVPKSMKMQMEVIDIALSAISMT